MRIRPRSSCWATAVLLFTGFTAGNAYDYKPPEIPPAGHAAKFAQHDTHKGEGVTVAVDPYGPEKDSVFHVKFADHRIADSVHWHSERQRPRTVLLRHSATVIDHSRRTVETRHSACTFLAACGNHQLRITRSILLTPHLSTIATRFPPTLLWTQCWRFGQLVPVQMKLLDNPSRTCFSALNF